jgi:hypothetical protein
VLDKKREDGGWKARLDQFALTFFENDRRFLFLIFMVTLATFWKALIAEFVYWDDNVLFLENPIFKMPLDAALSSTFGHFYHGDYLPLTLMSLWLDVQIFGLNSSAMHAINLLLHLLNIYLVFRLLQRLEVDRRLVLCLTAVFAFHPVQTEVAMWVSNRNTLLCIPFTLGALHSWLSFQNDGASRSRRHAITAGVCFVIATLCKFASVLLPFIFIVIDRYFRNLTWRTIIKRQVPLMIAVAAGLALRIQAYAVGVQQNFGQVVWNHERLQALPLTMLDALMRYVKMLAWPYGYTIIYPRFRFSTETWVFGALALGLILLVTWVYRRTRDRQILFFASLVLAFMLPILQILPRLNYVNERYLYFSIIGFVGLFVIVVRHLFQHEGVKFQKVLGGFGVFLICLMPLRSYEISDVWVKDIHLWENTVEQSPFSVAALTNYAMSLDRSGRTAEAIAAYEKGIAMGNADGTISNAYNNLAIMYSDPKRTSHVDLVKSAEALENAIKYSIKKEDTFTPRYNLALTYLQINQKDKARQVAEPLEADLIEAASADQKFLPLLDLARKLRAALN